MIVTKSCKSSILTIVGFAVFASISIQPSAAQTTDRTAGYKQITKSCAVETKRFCPALDPAAPQARSAAICLRPYKTSLSQACRRAVKAASP